MSRWYVAQVVPGLEEIAERNLTQAAYEVFSPMAISGREGRVRPVFPGYVFITFDPTVDRWRSINGMRGVVRLLPVGTETPIALPVGLVETIRDKMHRGGYGEGIEAVDAWLKELVGGEEIEVIGGAYASTTARAERIGKFLGREKGRVILLMRLFDRDIKVKVPIHLVAKAEQ